jgi:hypothetical protein
VSHSAQEMEARKDSQPGKESPPESRCRAEGESKRTKSANPKDSSGTRQPPLPPANDPQSKYDAAQEALALAFEGLFDLPERKAQRGFLHARARDEPTPEP